MFCSNCGLTAVVRNVSFPKDGTKIWKKKTKPQNTLTRESELLIITNTLTAITEYCTSKFIYHTRTPKYQDSFTQKADVDYWIATTKVVMVTTPLHQVLKVTYTSTNKPCLQGVSFGPSASGIWSKILTYTSCYLHRLLGSGLKSIY